MMNAVAGSKVAKALMLCVCPVVAGTVALKVPAARDAIHRATAPGKASPKRSRLVRKTPAIVTAEAVCPDPVPVKLVSSELPAFPSEELDGLTVLTELEEPKLAAETIQTASLATDPRDRVSVRRTSAPATPNAPIPEPAIWVQAIIGFGVAGTAIRMATRKRAAEAVLLEQATAGLNV